MRIREISIRRKREAFVINYCLHRPRRPFRLRRSRCHRRHFRCHRWPHACLSVLSFSLRRPLRSLTAAITQLGETFDCTPKGFCTLDPIHVASRV